MSADWFLQLLKVATPEIILIVTALAIVAVDLVWLRSHPISRRFAIATAVAMLGCAGAIVALLYPPVHGNLFNDMLLVTPLTCAVQIVLVVFAGFTLALSVDSQFTEHVGEFFLLILTATTGMMFLAASQDLLVIFISLELLSLSLYALTAFDKRSPRSAEAALKYFLFGGVSAAFSLYGFSLLYGLSNSTSLPRIAAALHGAPLSPMLMVAIVTTVIGFGFKVAAVPFHFWAPDVYQGAPAPVAGFIASASKIASFFIFFQVLTIGFSGSEGTLAWTRFNPGWVPVLAIVAVASMLLGNLAAIAQSSTTRLLAYSAIGHAGYMLLALVAHTELSLAALLYYVTTYALATLGAFAVVGAIGKYTGDGIAGLDGLSGRSPFLAAVFALFILSLAGIPPLAGFFGKFFLFVSVLAAAPGSGPALGLVILAIAMSAVSLYYYLRVLKRIYVSDPAPDATTISPPLLSQILVGLLAGAVLLLGCVPNFLISWITSAIHSSRL